MMFLYVLALTLLASVESSSGGGGNFNYDLSGAALTEVYNSPVFEAAWMTRPLGGTNFVFGPLSHSGVRVTLEDGSQWLIHKGENFGISSQTVVTNARHMSLDWRVYKTRNFQGTKTVSDFVAAGGSDYSLGSDNCHMAAYQMMNQ